jgi:hypothetical protein
MKKKTYKEVRSEIQPGDVIAFAGKDNFSDIIKWATRSNVSHVGVVLETKVFLDGNSQQGKIIDVMESTTLYIDPVTKTRTSGVQRTRLSRRVEYHQGEIWWLPLSPQARSRLNLPDFVNFLLNNDRKEYDMNQAVKAGLDFLDAQGATYATEDYGSFFCSELVSAAYEAGGLLKNVNSSEVTPADLCSFSLYQDDYILLTGEAKPIKGFNSMNPDGFGSR